MECGGLSTVFKAIISDGCNDGCIDADKDAGCERDEDCDKDCGKGCEGTGCEGCADDVDGDADIHTGNDDR